MPATPTALALSLAAETVPEVAPDTPVAVAVQESRLNRTAIHDNTDGRSYVPTTVEEAVTLATALIQGQHHSVDLRVMQVNSADFMRLGLSIADAFDPARLGPEPEQPNRLVEEQSVYPVMPTQVGIHVFPCCDQQDVDGGPSPAMTRWVSTAQPVKQLSRVGSLMRAGGRILIEGYQRCNGYRAATRNAPTPVATVGMPSSLSELVCRK